MHDKAAPLTETHRVCSERRVCLFWSNRSKSQRSGGGEGKTADTGWAPVYLGAWEMLRGSCITHSSEWQVENQDSRHTACSMSLTSSLSPVNKWSDFSCNSAMPRWGFCQGQIRRKVLKTGMWILGDQLCLLIWEHFPILWPKVIVLTSSFYFPSVTSKSG